VGQPLSRDVVLGALVLAVLAYAWNFSNLTVPNERTRVYLTVALFEEHTLAIDKPLERFGHVLDRAAFGGHNFTDKAPGASLLALPAYAGMRALHKPEQLTIDAILNAIRSYVMVPAGLLGFLALRWLLRRLAVSEPCLDLVSLSYALGSAALHYATAFYGHVLVATCALLSLLFWARAGALRHVEPELAPPALRHYGSALWAGAMAGLAGLIEYQAVVLSVLLVLPALRLGPRRMFAYGSAFVLGAAPFAAMLLLYNKQAFGSPFELSYHHLADPTLRAAHGTGLAGATKPTLAAFQGLMFAPRYGLFATSPLLGLGLIALFLPNPRMSLVLRAFLLLATAYFLGIVASSSVWYGGWAYGPRLLIPLLGLLAVSVGLLLDRYRDQPLVTVPLAAAALFGLVCCQLMQVTFSEPPPEIPQPIVQSALPMLQAGWVAPNLACKWGPLARANLWPLAALLLGVAGIIASSGRLFGQRLLHALFSTGLAAAALFVLVHAVHRPTAKESEGWLAFMRDLSARETSCSKQP
jgi:hypothetical protein